MSTSRNREVALNYAKSRRAPLMFLYTTKALNRGVSIKFLSMYPTEDEWLFPPMTYLRPVPDRPPREDSNGVLIIEVEPMNG